MDSPKSTRSKAVKSLRSLSRVRRPKGSDMPFEVFGFPILRRLDSKGNRIARKTDDRTIALMMAAVIEQGLETAILSRLPGIAANNEAYIFFDDGAPLRDFDSKIRMAFALGLFGDGVRSDLSLIRNVRNTFAHSRELLSFDTPEIAEACDHFTLAVRRPQFVQTEDAREKFISVGWHYAIRLITFDTETSDLIPEGARTISEFDPLPPRRK